MDMEVEHGLSGGFLIILEHIHTITAKHLFHVDRKLLCELHGICRNIFIDLIQICVMLLWKDERMASCCRTRIQD